MQIRWQSSDSAALGPLYVPSAVVASTLQGYAWSEATRQATWISTSTSGSPARTAGTQPDVIANGGLSPGHIAAIAVSVAIFILGILLAAFLIFRRKRRQLRAAGQLPTSASEDGPAELPYDPEASEKGVELPRRASSQSRRSFLPDRSPRRRRREPISRISRFSTQHTPELSGSLAPARTELPGH